MTCRIIPPYLLERLAAHDDPAHNDPAMAGAIAAARASLERDRPFRDTRIVNSLIVDESLDQAGARSGRAAPSTPAAPVIAARRLDSPVRTIFTASHHETLPGKRVRREGDAEGTDVAVNEAYAGLGDTHEFYRAAYQRASIDDDNLPLNATVHYGQDYDNAFWDGHRMVFGDGDGVIFTRMTASLSVIGHELTHGVTEFSANLTYQGQSGALNESVSDVFGALVEQRTLAQSVDQATWLIGAGIFTAAVNGVALRSLKAPGTAYNDTVLGVDPQPAHMDGYSASAEDNGGVHLNSGIPNHAFYLVAAQLGGNAWEGAGRIWYDALTGGALRASATFSDFARVTANAAAARYGDGSREHQAVRSGWDRVGIEL